MWMRAIVVAAALVGGGSASGQGSFVNWESPQIHPLDITPDGTRLLVANTADNRVEIFQISGTTLTPAGAVPVGLDPVTVRARTNTEAWVVNHISDTISVVDLSTRNVIATIPTGDEPCDVVFAGTPELAFVSVSQLNQVKVYDPADLSAAPTVLDIDGEDPRALATDGTNVYAAIFESGNNTTILDQETVSSKVNPYPAEPLDDENGNGEWDEGEPFGDVNGNGVWDPAEPFTDENGNEEYDDGEPFEDLNGNGMWDDAEPFIDQNGNGMYDAPETFTDLNGNGHWDDESPNPPPNDGLEFSPPLDPDLPLARPASLIVKKHPDGTWRDDNGGDWSAAVTWDVHDHDVAVIAVDSLAVSYVTGLMNLNMAIGAGPNGDVYVVGTDATNEIRFEPNLNGTFVRVVGATFTPAAAGAGLIADLNQHLDYLSTTVPQVTRDLSIGDPRGIDFNDAGDRVYVTGLGSNNLLAYDAALDRSGLVEVGEGPTGVRVNDAEGVVYVLNFFEGSVSIIDSTGLTELERLSFHDPTPSSVKSGRPFVYDTHLTSGLGHASCGSCHVNSRMDQIGWDLGVPGGSIIEFTEDADCNFGFGGCEDWHPVKGPFMTQTFVGISGTEPLHWRGDRGDLVDFNVAFTDLLGDDEQLNILELLQFQDFIDSLQTPPNPFRNIDGSLKDEELPTGGNPVTGFELFTTVPFDVGVTCVGCHTLPSGTNNLFTSGLLLQGPLTLKNPQLRTLYEKTGFDKDSQASRRGFGFTHDGSDESILEFLTTPIFAFPPDEEGDQNRLDLEAYLFSFSTDTHAGVGVQATIPGSGAGAGTALRDEMLLIADTQSAAVAVVAKGSVNGDQRGYVYLGGGLFQSDRYDEVVTTDDLDAAAGPGSEVTFTIVARGMEIRVGIDRDEDGYYDRDEIDHCSNPADPAMTPGTIEPACCTTVCGADPSCCDIGWDEACADQAADLCTTPCPSDVDGDLTVGVVDLTQLIFNWGPCEDAPSICDADIDGDGNVGVADLAQLILDWGPCP